MGRLYSATILSVIFLSMSGSTANAQFDYDFGASGVDVWSDYDLGRPRLMIVPEYEVWATDPQPLWVWDLILTYDDGSEEVYGTYYSENDAARALFRAVDYELVDLDALIGSRTERRNGRRPVLMGTFDARDGAEAAERWLDAFGWNPYIVVRWRTVWR